MFFQLSFKEIALKLSNIKRRKFIYWLVHTAATHSLIPIQEKEFTD